MATTTRQGPALRIEGSCDGCAHLARITSDESARICNHEHTAQPHHRLMTTGEPTPAWCPLLPAARLALARGIVAEAERAEELAREERIAKRSVFRLGEPR